jgi:hypothetical protein
MRTLRLLGAAALLAGAALTAVAGPAAADAPSGTPTPIPTATSADAPPTEAGTSFSTATVVQQGVQATPGAAPGD